MISRTLKLAFAVALMLVTAGVPAAHAQETTIYVSPSGVDTAAGTTSAPLRTLGAALSRATGGEQIRLAAGDYPAATDNKVRSTDVTVEGAGAGQTRVAGMSIQGGQHVRYSGITFTANVLIQGHTLRPGTQPGADITIGDSEFTSASSCITIKANAQRVAIVGNHVHNCYTGIAGPGNPFQSSGITIAGNTIEDITSDAMQFGSWDNVEIQGNVIRNIADPAGQIHNDGIQFTGKSHGVRIEQNQILNSRTQLILVQDAIGPIDDVAIVNNLLVKAGAVALQSMGATNTRIVNNTIWGGKDGGLWLRKGYTRDGTNVVPKDTLMSNNVTTIVKELDGATTGQAAGNVVECPGKYSGNTVPAGASCVSQVDFVDPTTGNYSLPISSPVRSRGSTLALPKVDLLDTQRDAPVPGAIEDPLGAGVLAVA